MTRRARLLLVDDHEVVREGLVAALTSDPRLKIVGAVSSGAAALNAASRTQPDIAVVDLRLPDTTGDRLCADLLALYPDMSVVVLSSYVSEDTVRDAMAAGAAAYVTKGAGLSELRKALAAAVTTIADQPVQHQIVSQLHRLVARRSDQEGVTPKQERVLELAAEGLTYREIGARLFISESTVRFHMQKLKAKFGARTKTDLIARAIRTGILTPATEDMRERL